MPDKNEKERRKQITNELREKAHEDFEKSLPLSRDRFKDLFDFLDNELTDNSCDHTLKFTKAFFSTKDLDNFDETAKWLNEKGGYCDCEVLGNVEEMFDDNAIL